MNNDPLVCSICGDAIFDTDEVEPDGHGGLVHIECAEAGADIGYKEADDWR